jgi:hypothetical protein
MKTGSTAAMVVLLVLPPLHLQVVAEATIGFTDYVGTVNGNPNQKVLNMHT